MNYSSYEPACSDKQLLLVAIVKEKHDDLSKTSWQLTVISLIQCSTALYDFAKSERELVAINDGASIESIFNWRLFQCR